MEIRHSSSDGCSVGSGCTVGVGEVMQDDKSPSKRLAVMKIRRTFAIPWCDELDVFIVYPPKT
jgi:hypothetical protein